MPDTGSLATSLANLEHSVGLSIYDTNLSDEIAAALISRKIGLDFDDTLQYYVAKKLGVDALVSFHEHFDKLDIQRIIKLRSDVNLRSMQTAASPRLPSIRPRALSRSEHLS
jgi:hypothetical protein